MEPRVNTRDYIRRIAATAALLLMTVAIQAQGVEIKCPDCGNGDSKSIPPTCTADGYYVCRVCGRGFHIDFQPALGHLWPDDWKNVPATCTSSGYNERTCQREGCGTTEKIEIPPLGHEFDANHVCGRCGLIALQDNSTNVIGNLPSTSADVLIQDRTLYKDGDWNTLCLPFALPKFEGTPLEGFTVMELDGSSGLDNGVLTLNFSQVTEIEAGRPYIVKWALPEPDLVITSGEEWALFANKVNNGQDSYAGKLVKLAADIDVTVMVGTATNPFQGTFDGDMHTMTLTITDTGNQGTAPFHYISGATIKNVKTQGTVTGTLHCAGLVGFAKGGSTNSIMNCEVAASVVCDYSHCGGILGHGLTSATTISDCLFSGTISGVTTATGIIYGWGDGGGTHSIVNCLSAGNYEGCSGVELLRKDGGTEIITNCYRKTTGGSQGTDASSMGNDELVAALGSEWEIDGGNVVPKVSQLPPVVSPLFQGVTITSTDPTPVGFTGGCFVGQYSPFEINDANRSSVILLGSGSTLGYSASARTLRPFRAHFEISATNPIKAYQMSFGEEGTETGIGLIQNSNFKIQNSNINIKNPDNAWYSLDGKKLNGKPKEKGIYINNGNRVVVK